MVEEAAAAEVVEQEVPSADRTVAVIGRAASSVMQEFQGLVNGSAAKTQPGLSGLNELAVKLTKSLKEMQALEVKVGQILDGTANMRVNFSTRDRAMKLATRIESNCETIARAVAELRTTD